MGRSLGYTFAAILKRSERLKNKNNKNVDTPRSVICIALVVKEVKKPFEDSHSNALPSREQPQARRGGERITPDYTE
jgi:hypothetical protein